MTERTARCACGQLSITCAAEPSFVGMCHCLQCQARTGSVFAVNAAFPTESVVARGDASVFSRQGDSGRTVTFHFCPRCGTTLYWRGELRPQDTVVAVGAFGDPAFPLPERAVWAQARHRWSHEPAGVPVFPKGMAQGGATQAPEWVAAQGPSQAG